ncbi:MAG TPA: hypothetical protein VHU20_06910 [Candidatus Eisenbacteria bacterium]|nr:hypothetical protein [Candidatus Eisenbacteria bacterium]
MASLAVAVIGAGPIGLEAALEAVSRGFSVCLYDSGRVGEHLRRYHHVNLFTPFAMNSTHLGRERLRSAGAILPKEDALLTAGELVDRYLEPLARLPELASAVRSGERVTHVGRQDLRKTDAVEEPSKPQRRERPFILRVACRGAHRFDSADFVIDASGVYGQAKGTGPGGLPAIGEESLGTAVEQHLSSRLVGDDGGYARGTTLLLGDGHSAATALVAIDALARSGGVPRVHWVRRVRPVPFPQIPGDSLPARLELSRAANEIANGAPWLTQHPGVEVVAYESRDGRVRVTFRDHGAERVLDVDRVLALVGYRPDVAMTRELQVHYCYASEGTMELAAAILGAGGGGGDCLAEVAHGPDSLRNPEPGFFVLGAKSYGRNPQFLLSIGHQQVKDAFELIGEAQGIAAPALAP